MKKISTILLLSIPSFTFAAAGFADAYDEYTQWILPAYTYCLRFGLVSLLVLIIPALIWRTKIREFIEPLSRYLVRHRVLAIMFTGILFGISLGIIATAYEATCGLIAAYHLMGMMIGFPWMLANRRFREKCLLYPLCIKWGLMVFISLIIASLLFVILTNHHLLSGTNITYVTRQHVIDRSFIPLTHPYDSLKKIWFMPLFFIYETIIPLLLLGAGKLNLWGRTKLYQFRHKIQEKNNSTQSHFI